MEKYEFKATGDPWIDAGITEFCEYIQAKDYFISCEKTEDIKDILEQTFEKIKSERYIKPTGNKICIFNKEKNDFEIVGKINLVGIFGKLFAGGNLKPGYDKIIFPEDRSKKWDELKENYKKQKVEFKKDNKGRVYSSKPKYKWCFKPNLFQTQVECTFCGYPIANTKIHANNYPFLVPVEKWANFYSQLSSKSKMCSFCEISSLFAVNRIFYNHNRKRKTLFTAIPHASSLQEIGDFWKDVRSVIGLKTLDSPSNIFAENETFRYTTYLNESIIAFAFKLYDELRRASDADRRLGLATTKVWYFFIGDTSGKVISFQDFSLFDEMYRLFKIFFELNKIGIDFKSLFSSLAMQEGKNYSNLWRETLSERLIKNGNINEIAEKIIWRKGEKIKDFTKFIKLYNALRG